MEILIGEKLGYLQANGGREFISNALKLYYKERSIKIRFTAPYIHEENGIAKRCWRILVIMKDALLIDSGLYVNFWIEAVNTSNYLQNRLSIKCFKHIIIPEDV